MGNLFKFSEEYTPLTNDLYWTKIINSEKDTIFLLNLLMKFYLKKTNNNFDISLFLVINSNSLNLF